jgi:hypothetical protein
MAWQFVFVRKGKKVLDCDVRLKLKNKLLCTI